MKKWLFIPIILFVALVLCHPAALFAQDEQVILVTSAADSGAGTLREALEIASPGTVINFSPEVFPKNNPVEIVLRSELPGLESGNVTIDASGAGVILVKDGEFSGTSAVRIRSASNTIKGLQIIGFPDFGILIEGSGNNNIIGGTGRGEGNTIGWIDGNSLGIFGDDNLIINNHLGIDREGKTHLSSAIGVYVGDGAQGNVIGGAFGVEGNIISGNGEGGILITNGSSATVIQGNIIGLDAAMKRNIGNSGFGIRIENSTDTLIGGEDVELGNFICGNADDGISIQGPASSANRIIGNTIGHPVYGLQGDQGVMIELGAHDNQIGPGNQISYSAANGITISGAETMRNTITANQIHNNGGIAIYLEDGANDALASPRITRVSSRRVQGLAGPGEVVEIYSDWEGEARFFECATIANADGEFICTLSQGAFRERMLKALATAEDGNSSMLSDDIQNPALIVMQELPDIIAPSQVSTDPAVIGTNLSLAVISLVFFGFTTTVFNDLVKENNMRIIPDNLIPRKLKDWFNAQKPVMLSDASKKKWRFILFWVAIVFINALIESFLAPNPRLLDAQRVRIILSLFLTGLLVTSIEWVTDWLARRRLLKEVKLIAQVRWVGLAAALASVVFSRLVAFTPGYILGTLGTIFLLPDLTDREKNGKRSAAILAALFTCGAVFWVISHFLAGFAPWIEPLFLNIFTISVQGVLFELLPLSVCEGRNIWDWNKLLWFGFFGVSVFTFLHTFLNPDTPDLQALRQNGVQILLMAMAVYGLATLFLWLKSKQNKPKRTKEQV
jgi:parallel beta-helix repeat protein